MTKTKKDLALEYIEDEIIMRQVDLEDKKSNMSYAEYQKIKREVRDLVNEALDVLEK